VDADSYIDFLFGMLVNNDESQVKISDFLAIQIKPGDATSNT